MPIIDVTTYYVEMFEHVKRAISPPREGLSIVHAKPPTVRFYRYLYNAVGEDYNWRLRRKLPDSELQVILDDPGMEIHVLYVGGVPAGFAEVDRRKGDDVELLQFGLMPEFFGQGLGKYFLQGIIDTVWSYKPRRFWLHTCTVDHIAALPNYLKAGFKLYKEETMQRDVPEGLKGISAASSLLNP